MIMLIFLLILATFVPTFYMERKCSSFSTLHRNSLVRAHPMNWLLNCLDSHQNMHAINRSLLPHCVGWSAAHYDMIALHSACWTISSCFDSSASTATCFVQWHATWARSIVEILWSGGLGWVEGLRSAMILWFCWLGGDALSPFCLWSVFLHIIG